MDLSRRSFMAASLAGLSVTAARPTAASPPPVQPPVPSPAGGFDPWLEVDAAVLRGNAAHLARLAGGRPILAVVKNNAYGLGLGVAGPILDTAPDIGGLAVVKADAALALREAGVRKPILLMGPAEERDARELVRRDVRLAPFTDDDVDLLRRVSRQVGTRVRVHCYLDTGMGRLGMPWRRALPWLEALVASGAVHVEGAFMTFVEDDDFDPEQLRRFRTLAAEARSRGVALGRLHAASTHALFHRHDALLDMVRPGLALYGAYPAGGRSLDLVELVPAFRLKARVVRVERLEAGDSVSYGRSYVARQPTWVATLPVGHADGYPRGAVKGCEVLIGGRTYPVIGAVSASHTIVELGDEPAVRVGDDATLVGPDHPAIHPNTVAERAGVSVYDVLMHLSQGLPRVVI